MRCSYLKRCRIWWIDCISINSLKRFCTSWQTMNQYSYPFYIPNIRVLSSLDKSVDTSSSADLKSSTESATVIFLAPFALSGNITVLRCKLISSTFGAKRRWTYNFQYSFKQEMKGAANGKHFVMSISRVCFFLL